tara:strand:+ start:5849 stop:6388 length:540 start_codon:yes stop_codon:yes gene_type:complete
MNIKRLVASAHVLRCFAGIATASAQAVYASTLKISKQLRPGNIGIKRYISRGIMAILLAFVSFTYADDNFSSEQEALNQKIAAMEALVTAMEVEPDGWKLRSSMQEHAKIMEESARLASEMAEAAYGVDCPEITENRQGIRICDDPGSIRNSQYRLLVVLLRHVIYRQNIIMEKAGIFK